MTIEANIQLIQEKTFERSNISTITLINNKIRRIKDNAFKSFAIYFLDLQNNLLSEIEGKSFAGAVNLRKLNLQHNQISNIQSDAFIDLGNLEEINLAFNHISAFPSKTFWPLTAIQTVHLNNNLLTAVEINVFVNNKMLQDLNINNNDLTYLDASHFPHSLVNLNVDQNNLQSINMSNLINLQKLVLDLNKLKTVTHSLLNLPLLNSLHLNNNIMGPIITENTFSNLTNLTILELDNNQITNFESLKKLTTLEGLSLAENHIKIMDFSGVPTIVKLINLTHNNLIKIQNLSKLSSLVKLELSYNNLEEIDFNIFENLFQLRNLWLQHNRLKKLTLGCFRHLKSLEYLDLSYNQITDISAGSLNGLDTIAELNLSYNRLLYLNEDIFHNMKDLRSLGIAFNNLTNLNVKGILTHTIWLKEIDLDGNNWTCKLLSNLSRDNKLLTIKGGGYYNVSNIYGIPCREIDESLVKSDITNKNVTDSVNEIITYTHDVSVKLSIIVTLLILFLILECGKYLFSRYSKQITAAKQFVYQKSQSEPEIHLI